MISVQCQYGSNEFEIKLFQKRIFELTYVFLEFDIKSNFWQIILTFCWTNQQFFKDGLFLIHDLLCLLVLTASIK